MKTVSIIRVISLFLVTFVAAQSTAAQPEDATSQTLPLKPTRTIEFTVDEGTDMTVDVSPDGKSVLFDLLGDLYTLPIVGGKAKPLLIGQPWDSSPRYSPDGRYVAFISDRVGLPNLWVLEIATRKLRQLTHAVGSRGSQHPQAVAGTPEWLSRGFEIAYGRQQLSTRMTAIDIKTKSERDLFPSPDWAHKYSVSFTRDGKTAYFAARFRTNVFTTQISRLYRFDVESGKLSDISTEPTTRGRWEYSPQVSRTGQWLAYVRRGDGRDGELRIRDLVTGVDRPLTELKEVAARAGAGALQGEDVVKRYAFTPDDRYIVLWNDGKLRRISVESGAMETIPFSADVRHFVRNPVRSTARVESGPLNVRAIRWPTISRDGRTLVFSAVGYLWIVDLPDGTPRRLTANDGEMELTPRFSPDGKHLAYVTSRHTSAGTFPPARLVVRDMRTGMTDIVREDSGGMLYFPSWSLDGNKLAIIRETYPASEKGAAEFGWVNLGNRTYHSVGAMEGFIADDMQPSQQVYFTSDGNRLLYQSSKWPAQRNDLEVRSIRLDGSDDRVVAVANPFKVQRLMPAPDLSKIAFLGADQALYVADLSSPGGPPVVVTSDAVASVYESRGQKISTSSSGAMHPYWSDSTTLTYQWTTGVYQSLLGRRAQLRRDIHLAVPRRLGKGVVAYRGATIITINGQKGSGSVIRNGTLIVTEDRITAIGPSNRITIPRQATVVDVLGMTIMPGLIETHAHGLIRHGAGSHSLGTPSGIADIHDDLAFGVTTGWEPGSGQSDAGQSQIEIIEAGRLAAPRYFSFAGYLTSAGYTRREGGERYSDYDSSQVEPYFRRGWEIGGPSTIKSYNAAERDKWQRAIKAASRFGVGVVGHTQYTSQALAQAEDGIAIDHHPLPVPLYDDVVQLLARTGAIWTPHHTHVSRETEPGAREQVVAEYLKETSILADAVIRGRLQRGGSLRKLLEDGRQYATRLKDNLNFRAAQDAVKLVAAGAKISSSLDGFKPLDSHVDLWLLNKAGMPAGDVLRTATLTGAEKLGIDRDVGSLEVGKLADFLILSGNPLERIENTIKIKRGVVAGVIYDGDTLDVMKP